MARRPGRDIQPDPVNNLLPKLHFRFECVGPQQMPHVNPTEQTRIALETRNPGFLQPVNEPRVAALEPLLVLDYVRLRELLVRKDRG